MLAQYALHKGNKIECRLCPHRCNLSRGEMGKCRVRRYDYEGLVSLNYGKISVIQIDPIEKKPLNKFMSGTNTLSIGSYGCNLSCAFCQNHGIAFGFPRTYSMSSEEIVDQAIRSGMPSISYTYNEPIVSYEFVLDTAQMARRKGLINIMVTNGYIEREPFLQLAPFIDAMNIDLKAFSDQSYRKICGGNLAPVLKTIELAYQFCHIEITTLLVTNMHTREELMKMIDWITDLSPEIPLHLSRYFPKYFYTQTNTPLEWIDEIYNMAANKLTNVYKGNC